MSRRIYNRRIPLTASQRAARNLSILVGAILAIGTFLYFVYWCYNY